MHPHLPARTHREVTMCYQVEVLIISTGKTKKYLCNPREMAEKIKKSWDEVNDPTNQVYVENVATITEYELS